MRMPLSLAIAAVALSGPAGAADTDAPASWSCRNMDVEVRCADGACAVSDGHTAMDVQVSAGDISACAYTTCWSGEPALVTTLPGLTSYVGTGLVANSATYEPIDIVVTIDTERGAASILIPGLFVNPAICDRDTPAPPE